MEIKLTTGKAEYNRSNLGNSKDCVFVEFPNCISTTTNKSFKWMPTYEQLREIEKALNKIEQESWR
jgi:hypothetical protein